MIFVAVLVFLASFGVCDTLTHKDREVTGAGQGLWHQSCYFADIFVFADSYSIHCAKPMFIKLLYISIKHALSMRKGFVYSYFGGLTNWLKACSSDHDTICLPVFKNVKSKESTCSHVWQKWADVFQQYLLHRLFLKVCVFFSLIWEVLRCHS